ncbi:MAG: peptidoglycan DD-metalloendopeptidase family protein [Panacagrimonas sp.]
MIPLFALQFALPLILIAWIGIAPLRSLLGFGVQVVATALGLFALALTGVWILPPWWAPYAFAGLLLLAIAVGLRRRRPYVSVIPSGLGAWTATALYLALGGIAVGQASMGLAGRNPPPARMVELAFPLAGATYLIVNGGSELSVNGHMKTLDAAVPRFRVWRGQSYGIDVVKVDRFGLRANGLRPSEPSAYRVYGAEVFAPCTGEIVSATDGLPDMQVPETDRDNMAGNHVILRCGDANVLLGHFRPGSLEVVTGARVNIGDRLAAVGNSGNSDEPHLHIHAQTPGTVDEPMSGDPLPIRFSGRFLVRNDHVLIAEVPDKSP